jgi:hypothetical protein
MYCVLAKEGRRKQGHSASSHLDGLTPSYQGRESFPGIMESNKVHYGHVAPPSLAREDTAQRRSDSESFVASRLPVVLYCNLPCEWGHPGASHPL